MLSILLGGRHARICKLQLHGGFLFIPKSLIHENCHDPLVLAVCKKMIIIKKTYGWDFDEPKDGPPTCPHTASHPYLGMS